LTENTLDIKEELKKNYNIDYNNFKKVINDQVLFSSFCNDIKEKKYHKKNFLRLNHKLFNELINILNSHFDIKMNEKFWRILIGRWFFVASETFYNRYNSIKELIDKKKYSKLIFKDLYNSPYILRSNFEFCNMLKNLDWNQSVIFEITKKMNIPYDIQNFKTKKFFKKKEKRYFFEFKKIINKFLLKINSKSSILLISTSLSRLKETLLQLKYMNFFLFNLPDLFEDIKLKYYYDSDLRNTLCEKNLKNSEKEDQEEQIIKYLLIKYMPIIYLENFKFLSDQVHNFNFKLILTSQHYDDNEYYKFLAAYCSSKKSKIVYLQHGNVDGVSEFDIYNNHILSVYKYLTWGWSEQKNKNSILSFYNIKNSGYKKFNKKFKFNRSLIFFSTAIDQNKFFFDVQERNKKKYFDQLVFFENLNSEIRLLTKVKLYNGETGHPDILAKTLKDKIPKIKIIKKNKKIFDYKNLLSVYSYDSTGFLEHICLNKPCLMYIDDYRNEVNEFSLPYYDKLKKIDLIHNSAEDASKFVNKNWNNILDWWYSDEVQSTIFEFSNNFSRYTPEPIKEINNFLEKEIEK